ncbi:T9SS type A sorting domain-containing protein [Pontibacter qinzhouensis]|uniref:T9SS type A sorting domain-containing protein n=1 Tax=Pontibacter qinzhouensis TaxID=2603253 RepID=A0A5C8JAR9_9BACT|nr:PA14 domain-containing protein [Pontibacter qinzhouensis]TXK33777.1 T9SS type A sorting domain-containing protein [Pontibacter qinzhouensis]
MNTIFLTSPERVSRTLLALLTFLVVYVVTTTSTLAQSYSGPIVITKGGTYTGNWESRNSDVPAVDIQTSEPVIIVNSNIRGAGYLIRSWSWPADLTVRNCNGYGLTPTNYSGSMKPRRFLTVNAFKNIVVENNYMESTAGIYLGTSYDGNGTPSQTIKIRYNKAKNIDGRVHNGFERSQFVQFNFRKAVRHAEVAWNEVINEADKSLVEDNINMYNTRGTADSPIRIHNNFIQGAFPIPSTKTEYSGGGIITDGDGNINICPAYITASDNQLVGLGNYSMGIAGGNNIRYVNNRVVTAAVHSNGREYAMYTSGFWSKDYYRKNTTFSNSISNNIIGVVKWRNPQNRNDISVAEHASFTSNTHMPNPITLDTERAEVTRWAQKLQQNGIKLGPNGSGPTNTNQAPTVAFTAPSANAAIVLGTGIQLAANANDADGSISKVEFFQGSTKLGEATSSPYTYNWTNAKLGIYSLTAKATDNQGATTTSAAISITVINANLDITKPGTGGGGSGKIVREMWANVRGSNTSDIPLHTAPTSVTELTVFEAPTDVADNYGARIRGYVTAPITGDYTFWVAGDNNVDLFLSTSEDPGHKTRIAYVNGWTNSREWTKYGTQRSRKITLQAGQRYYIEALHKEDGGGDNLAVGWDLPNGTQERPIGGNRLSSLGTDAPIASISAPSSATTPTGKITRDLWRNTHGIAVNNVPVTTAPNQTTELTSFEAPSGQGNNYGQRIRGYVTAPTSGQYTFWIAGDDVAELWLSTSDNPSNKRRIAHTGSWTHAREWEKTSSQKSGKITLEAGKRYYIEAIHIQGGGGDNLAVGWELPNGTQERPIAGNRLSPISTGLSATAAATAAQTDLSFTEAAAYPNPFRDAVTLDLGENGAELQEVVIFDQAGKVVYKEANNLKLDNNRFVIDLSSSSLNSGLYILRYTDAKGSSKTFKLVKE